MADYGNIFQSAPQQNPLGMIGGFADLARTVQQTQLLQQRYQGFQALPELSQQAMRPDGTMDYDKLGMLVSTDRRTGQIAPEVVDHLLTQGLIQQNIFGAKIKNAQDMTDIFGQIVTPAITKMQADARIDPNTGQKQFLLPADPSNPDKADVTSLINAAAPYVGGPLGPHIMQEITALKGMPLPQASQALMDFAQSNKDTQESIGRLQQHMELKVPQWAGGPTVTHPAFGNIMTQEATPQGVSGVLGPNALTGGAGAGQPNAPGTGGMGGGPQSGATANAPNATDQLGAAGPRTPGATLPGGAPPTPATNALPNALGTAPARPTGYVSDVGPVRAAELKNVGDYEKDLAVRIDAVQSIDGRINQALQHVSGVRTGGGAELRAEMGQALQAVPGVDRRLVDAVNGGDLGATQYLQKLFTQLGTENMGALIHKVGGRLAQSEWAVGMTKGFANINTDPRAIVPILKGLVQLNRYTRMESTGYWGDGTKPGYRDYAMSGRTGYDLAKWPQQWQRTLPKILERENAAMGAAAGPARGTFGGGAGQ